MGSEGTQHDHSTGCNCRMRKGKASHKQMDFILLARRDKWQLVRRGRSWSGMISWRTIRATWNKDRSFRLGEGICSNGYGVREKRVWIRKYLWCTINTNGWLMRLESRGRNTREFWEALLASHQGTLHRNGAELFAGGGDGSKVGVGPVLDMLSMRYLVYSDVQWGEWYI